MKHLRLTSDITLGISIVVFSYVYWFVYTLEVNEVTDHSPDEILRVTVDFYYIAFAFSIIAAVTRLVYVRKNKIRTKFNWFLIALALTPLAWWLYGTVQYAVQ